MVRRDVALQERPVRLAEQLVLRLEQRALVLDGVTHCAPHVRAPIADLRYQELAATRYTNRMVGLPRSRA